MPHYLPHVGAFLSTVALIALLVKLSREKKVLMEFDREQEIEREARDRAGQDRGWAHRDDEDYKLTMKLVIFTALVAVVSLYMVFSSD